MRIPSGHFESIYQKIVASRFVRIKWVIVGICIIIVGRTLSSTWVKSLVMPRHDAPDVEIFESSLRGYDNQKVSWVIKAKTIWAKGNRTTFKIENLYGGQLFDGNGNVIVSDIKGKYGEVNTRSKIVVINDLSARMGYRQKGPHDGLIASGVQPRSVRIFADEMRYFGTSKRTYLSGKVTIIQGEHLIVPKNGVEVDNSSNIAYIKDGFTIYISGATVTGNTMTIYIDDERSVVPDGIVGYRSATPTDDPELDTRENSIRKKPTRFSADKMEFSSRNGEDIVIMEGRVMINQPDKSIAAQRLIYNRTDDVLSFDGSVVIMADHLRWAIQRKTPIKNEDIRKSVNQAIKILGDSAVFEGQNKRGRVIGNVRVDQESQRSTSKKLEFDDELGLIRLIGNVEFVKPNRDKLLCQELVIDINKEEMIAKRSITTEFRLKGKSRDAVD